MMKFSLELLLLFMLVLGKPFEVRAQMVVGGDTLYGNEWINYDREYLKIKVADDGVYRIGFDALQAAGWNLDGVSGTYFRLFCRGEERPLYVTSGEGAFQAGDYLEFFGKKNRGEFDRYLFEDPEEEMLNPAYSLYSDTAAYYLVLDPNGAGRRVINRTDGGQGALSLQTVRVERIQEETANYFGPPEFGNYKLLAEYSAGEGYGRIASNYQRDLELPGLDPAGGVVEGQVRSAIWPGQNQIAVSIDNQQVFDSTYSGRQVIQRSFQWPASEISNEQIRFRMQFTGTAAVASVIYRYPMNLVSAPMEALTKTIWQSGGEVAAYPAEGFAAGGEVVAYTGNGDYRFPGNELGGRLVFNFSEVLPGQDIYFAAGTAIRTIGADELAPITFGLRDLAGVDYLIISHSSLAAAADAFRAYRSSAVGGSYQVGVVDVSQLYEEYSYGIWGHPLSIRHLLADWKKRGSTPEFVLLLGKGLEYLYSRTDQGLRTQQLVPTYGYPSSDQQLLPGGIEGLAHTSIGRIAATANEEAMEVLEKIRVYEAPPGDQLQDRFRQKRVIHLGGGANTGEQSAIRSYLEGGANLLAGSDRGEETFAFYKSSNDVIQESPTKQIQGLIDEGIALLTFFGHSSSNTFDFSINNPADFANEGKYPVLFALGCNAGRITTPNASLSEDFLFEPGKGSVAFVGTSGVGYLSSLGQFIQEIYKEYGDLSRTLTIGEVLGQAIRNLAAINSSFGAVSLTQITILHGDPALRLPNPLGPDLTVDAGSVTITPSPVNKSEGVFRVDFDLYNLGRNLDDSITLKLILEDGQGVAFADRTYRAAIPVFRETVTLEAPLPEDAPTGRQYLSLELDPDNRIAEWPADIGEANNRLTVNGEERLPFVVIDNALTPVLPRPNGIVVGPAVRLAATNDNPFSGVVQPYVFELDTVNTFSSPALRRHRTERAGGIVEWTIDGPLLPGQLYFWRVSLDSTVAGTFAWAGNAFTYTEEPEANDAWIVSHPIQCAQGVLTDIVLDTTDCSLAFREGEVEVRFFTGQYPLHGRAQVSINNQATDYFPWGSAGVRAGFYIVVIDPNTKKPWLNEYGGKYGSYLQTQPDVALENFQAFPYRSDLRASRKAMIDFVETIVPEGFYVLIYSVFREGNNMRVDSWAGDREEYGTDLFEFFEGHGARRIREMEGFTARPYFLFFKKGDPAFNPEEGIAVEESTVAGFWTLSVRVTQGSAALPKVGPARSWGDLDWAMSASGKGPGDEARLEIWGIRREGQRQKLRTFDTPGRFDLTGVSAQEYPYLEPVLILRDSVDRTPWRPEEVAIRYTATPELALDRDPADVWPDSLQRGAPLQLAYWVENLGAPLQDSMAVVHRLVRADNSTLEAPLKVGPIDQGGRKRVEVAFQTETLGGPVHLQVELNPAQEPLEYTTNNNLGTAVVEVVEDRKAPLLQVTFDGAPIMDGDLVGAQPEIVVTLRDENPYLSLGDSSLMVLSVQAPSDGSLRRVPFGPNLWFEAAPTGGKGEARLIYRPEFLESGVYILEVAGRDATGNAVGEQPYRVRFQVELERSIKHLVNYPNPFTTSTRFAYEITGDAAPGRYFIRIYTASGRLARELSELDLGPLRIGRHLTDGAWDGADSYGDRLANGVYFYQLFLPDDTYERRDAAGKSFGRLVIFR